MTVEPEPMPLHPSSECRDREELPPDQEVIRLFDELYTPLRRYVIFLGLPPEDAEDAVQETFLRLYKHLGSRRDRANLRGWLFHVARNLARD
jgi:RNA polymerase sigma-70 factor (ECF subfamily)